MLKGIAGAAQLNQFDRTKSSDGASPPRKANETMRVLYEGAVFELMPRGGVARYFKELIDHLPDSVEPWLTVPEGLQLHFRQRQTRLEPARTDAPIRALRSWWRRSQHSKLAAQRVRLRPTITHWTYYYGLCRSPMTRGSAPNVITLYDFIHEAFPQLDRRGKTIAIKREAIEKADHICCISQTTYDELCNRFPAAAKRASVTLLGSSFSSVEAAPIGPELARRPYILFVGRRDCYKNFENALSAWKSARQKLVDLHFVVAGPGLTPQERATYRLPAETPGLIEAPNVSDPILKSLYQNCSAFVFPSRMEGFGLPALEAMESGAVVIAANCPALREVIGSAGYFFDADDDRTLSDLLVAAGRGDLPERDQIIRRGYEQAAKFSWTSTAKQTAAVYAMLQQPAQQAA